jgi:hypothetical protein
VKKIDFYKQVYPDCKMSNPYKPPVMIFLPTADIMLKLIKVCVGAQTPEEALAKF